VNRGRPASAPARLDDRVLATLEGSAGRLAFTGLRRLLGAHPESLSRSLHRLEREGLVERVDGGYRALVAPPSAGTSHGGERRAIARVELPPGTSVDDLTERVAGRWFGSLRWVGAIDGGSERLLVWSRRDGLGRVVLGLRPHEIVVYGREGEAGGDPGEAEDAAYELLYHAVQAFRPRPDERGTTAALLVTAGTRGPPVDN